MSNDDLVALTPRLELRLARSSDLAAFCDLFGDPVVMRYSDGAQPAAWVEDWLRWCQQQYTERGYGPYSVVEREQGQVIGYCGLFFFPDIHGRPEVELGYRLRQRWWGHGYATEAARAICQHAFGRLGLPRLIALIDPGNRASVGVARKLGMRHESDLLLPGYTHPDHVYALGVAPADLQPGAIGG